MDKPRINPVGDWRAPSVPAGDTIVFDEPGRTVNNIDFGSHYYRATRSAHGPLMLRVKHGGGERVQNLGYDFAGVEAALGQLDSDSRYLMMHALHEAHTDAKREGYNKAAREHKEAFAEGRLKKRKVRGHDLVKVWIESPLA